MTESAPVSCLSGKCDGTMGIRFAQKIVLGKTGMSWVASAHTNLSEEDMMASVSHPWLEEMTPLLVKNVAFEQAKREKNYVSASFLF